MTLGFYQDFQELFTGCVAYYDLSPNGVIGTTAYNIINSGTYDGTITGASRTGTDRFGKVNNSLLFNSTGNYVTCSPPINFGKTTPFSVLFVFNPSNTNMGAILSRAATDTGLLIKCGTTGFYVYFSNTWTSNLWGVGFTTTVSGWSVGCITFNGVNAAGIKGYNNGIVVTPVVDNNTLTGEIGQTANMVLGYHSWGTSNLNYLLDEVLIFNREISNVECRTISTLLLKKKMHSVISPRGNE